MRNYIAGTVMSNEKDPNGLKPCDPGAKLDEGKVMAGVLFDFSMALHEVARVGTLGAQKYSRGGWQYVENGEERYYDAMVRHLLAEKTDGEWDLQLGDCYHMAQVIWNACAVLELRLRERI